MIRTRIAPTPSGYLHLGNGASFVLTALLARSLNGKVLLRIDDLDRERYRKEYVEDIFRTLDWLGIEFDEGPVGPDDFEKNWSQQLRMDNYSGFLDQLTGKANLLYACECTRSQLTGGFYPGTCINKQIPLETPGTAWRIRTGPDIRFSDLLAGEQKINLTAVTGDFVVRTRLRQPAYQVTSLCDDLHFDVNLVVRGADLLSSTASQLYLEQLNGGTQFSRSTFVHHPLVNGPETLKLSKSGGAGSLKAARESDRDPGFVYQVVASWIGLDLPKYDAQACREILMDEIRKWYKKTTAISTIR